MNKSTLRVQALINRAASMQLETLEACERLRPEKTYSASEVLEFILAERERCAKIAETMRENWDLGPVTDDGYKTARADIAYAIRKDRGCDPPQAEAESVCQVCGAGWDVRHSPVDCHARNGYGPAIALKESPEYRAFVIAEQDSPDGETPQAETE